MQQDTPQIVLPTLAYANNMQMDCEALYCYETAKRIIYRHECSGCKSPLQIHHQKINDTKQQFQVIVRHDYGEACMVFIHSVSLDLEDQRENLEETPSAEYQITEWLQQVHEYEGAAR